MNILGNNAYAETNSRGNVGAAKWVCYMFVWRRYAGCGARRVVWRTKLLVLQSQFSVLNESGSLSQN